MEKVSLKMFNITSECHGFLEVRAVWGLVWEVASKSTSPCTFSAKVPFQSDPQFMTQRVIKCKSLGWR